MWETSKNKLKKHSVNKNGSDLSLFEWIVLVVSKTLQILSLQPQSQKFFSVTRTIFFHSRSEQFWYLNAILPFFLKKKYLVYRENKSKSEEDDHYKINKTYLSTVLKSQFLTMAILFINEKAVHLSKKIWPLWTMYLTQFPWLNLTLWTSGQHLIV